MHFFTMEDSLVDRQKKAITVSNALDASVKTMKDLVNDLKTDRPTSVLSAIFIICNTCLGAATLSMPFTFHQAGGVYASMAVMTISAVLMAVTLVIFGYAQEYSTRKLESMGDFADEFVGPKFALITEIVLFGQLFGICAAYILVIKDQIHLLMLQLAGESYYEEHWFVDGWFLTACLTVLIICPLCLNKDLDFLKYPSYLVILGIIYVVMNVFIRYLTSSHDPEIATKPEPVYRAFDAFPIILLGFSCHFNAAPVYANMERRTITSWTKVSLSASFFCFLCYSIIGVAGYLSYGETVDSDIIKCLPHSVDATIARAMMTIAVTFSYPCVYNVGRTTLVGWIKDLKLLFCGGGQNGSGTTGTYLPLLSIEEMSKNVTFCGFPLTADNMNNLLVTVIWVVITCFIGILAKSLESITGFIGSLTSHQFLVLPGVILAQTSFRHRVNVNYNETTRYKSTSWRLFKIISGIVIAAIGGFVLFHGLTTATVLIASGGGAG